MDFKIEPQTGRFETTSQGIAAVVDEAARVALNDFNSGRSDSWRSAEGLTHIRLSARLLRGRPNEQPVLQVLSQCLEGRVLEGIDANGQDAVLIDPRGSTFTIQIVTVPTDPEINMAIGRGETIERALTDEEAARWIASSIEKKIPVAAGDVILALDARPFALLTHEAVIAQFLAGNSNLTETAFCQVWLVGPLPARSVRLL